MLIDFINTIKDENTIWVLENRENSDGIFKQYVTDKLFSSTYVIVSKSIAYVFVHKLDEVNIKDLDKTNCKVFIYDNLEKLKEYILQTLVELDFPSKLLLSYTTMSDENTDVISYSSYKRVSKLFRNIYKQNNKKFNIKSSEMNIYEIISKYNNSEIKRLKILANITDDILKKSFYSIKNNQSELEIVKNTEIITKTVLNELKDKYDIIDYSLAWDICPIVLIGDNLEKGGHAMASELKIKPGDTIYFDFGIKATFKDGMTLYTDIQRMGYFLNENEQKAPLEVQKIFNTLITSISKGIDTMKPGVRGYKVDEIVRGEILKNNYPNYFHATGHPVGREVHAAGALISSKGSKRANLKLVENGIYTLEPRINIKNGGSIEEMILVTQSGSIPLCNRQMDLYLIKEKR